MGQNVTANTNTYVFGSGKLEAGDDVGSLVCLGSLRGATFQEAWDSVEIETDNAGKPIKKIKNQKATLKAGLLEVDLSKFYALRGGIDLYTTVAGTPVTNHSYVVASGSWNYDKFIELDHQNGDKSKITPDSVTAGTDGALTLNTDYAIVEKTPGSGIWGIVIWDSATLSTEAQSITIVYDYTPAASRTLTSGGKYVIDDKVIRLTHTTEDGKILRLTLYKAHVGGGLELTFPSDESDDVMEVPFEMVGELDVSRSSGDQLYEIYDTRSYS